MYVFVVCLALTIGVFIGRSNADIIVYTQFSNQVIEEFRDLPARFGAPIPLNGMKVLAVEANPVDGCSNLEPPPKNHSNVKWAVVIARFNCSFEQKVRYAQTAGYSAAIVYNIGSNDLEQMSANNDEGIVIPSIFVGETTGKIINYNYQFYNQFALVINDDLPFNINTHLILPFTIVVGLCFVIMIGFMIVKCVREQRRLRRHRLPNAMLKKIPSIRFSKGQQSESYETCAICLEDYVDGDKLRILPCSHAYHCNCIDPWLTKNRRVCPICKRKVFARGEPRRRARRSSDDTTTDSDGDDTTPLLNPVDHTANHGTFPRPPANARPTTASSSEEGLASPGPPPRINPFDRAANIAVNVDVIEPTTGLWHRFMSIFIHSDPQQMNLQPQSSHESSTTTVHVDEELAASPTTSSSANSNNILNQNLSGSFRAPQPPAPVAHVSYEEEDARGTIYQPIGGETQGPAPAASRWPASRRTNHCQYQPLSNSRLGVVAIPNQNFQPPAVPDIQPASGDMRRSHRDRDAEDNTQRASPASSEKFFV